MLINVGIPLCQIRHKCVQTLPEVAPRRLCNDQDAFVSHRLVYFSNLCSEISRHYQAHLDWRVRHNVHVSTEFNCVTYLPQDMVGID
jgi:hypothetical protein